MTQQKSRSLCGHSMCAISMIYHWDDTHERNVWRDADTLIYSKRAPPCGDECYTVVWLWDNVKMSKNQTEDVQLNIFDS